MAVENGPLFYMPAAQALDSVGVSIPGAILRFDYTATDTLAPIWANGALTVPLDNPLTANSAGVFVPIYLDPTITYKVTLFGPDDGINPPQQLYSWDPCKYPWPSTDPVYFDMPFEFFPTPTANQVIGLYVANRPQRFSGNFDGSGSGLALAHGFCITHPTATWHATGYLNDSTIVASMFISTSGVFSFNTTGGTSFDLDTGDALVWRSALEDATLANFAWTLPGVNL